jgi:hypothetical protein
MTMLDESVRDSQPKAACAASTAKRLCNKTHNRLAVTSHLALAVAGHAVGVQRQESALEMSCGTAQFTQGNLQLLGFLDGVAVQ